MCANEVIKSLGREIEKASFFTIMADESADVSNQEQVVVCVRWVNDKLQVFEDFVAIEPIARCTSDEIVQVLKAVLDTLNLPIEKCRGQCYDGASVMKGKKNGVAKQFKDLNKKILYTHCYGHALNLSIKDVCENIKCLNDTFTAAKEIVRLVKFSPQRETMIRALRLDSGNSSPNIHAFCPTRWTVRGDVLESILNNHSELLNLWDVSLTLVKDAEIKARIIGAQHTMKSFNFVFGCFLGSKILKQTDNLSRTLQHKELSAVEAQEIAVAVIAVLEKDRSTFNSFWKSMEVKVQDLDVNEPSLPRKTKKPLRFDPAASTQHQFANVEDMYRKVYIEAHDLAINAIRERFDQEDFQLYSIMQTLLINSVEGKETTEWFDVKVGENSFRSMYADDINMATLETQLTLLRHIMGDVTSINMHSIFKYIRDMSVPKRNSVNEVTSLIKLLMVAPATNAESERIFSTMKLIKSYLRSTMGQHRFKSLMTLRIYHDRLDELNMMAIYNDFVKQSTRRLNKFGVFRHSDLQKTVQHNVKSASSQTD